MTSFPQIGIVSNNINLYLKHQQLQESASFRKKSLSKRIQSMFMKREDDDLLDDNMGVSIEAPEGKCEKLIISTTNGYYQTWKFLNIIASLVSSFDYAYFGTFARF